MIDSKKVVVHLIVSLDNGGTENVLLRTLPLLNGSQNIVFVFNRNGSLTQEFINNGIIVVFIKDLFDLLVKLDEVNPSIVFTHLFYADIIGRLWLLFFKKKYRVIPYLQTSYNFSRYWPARLFERLTKFLVDRYLANSDAVKNYYCKKYGIDCNKITVVPNGIDIQKIDKTKPNLQLAKELKITEEDTVFVCVANLLPNKGHKYLLLAFSKLKVEYGKVKLLIVGDGPEKENIENIIKELDLKDVTMLGRRRDVLSILKISDIFVLPTFFEGLSNAIMEAMASRLPVITTNIPENRELVGDKVNGLLCIVANSDDLFSKMKFLMERRDLRSKMGNRGYCTICNKYRIDDIALFWEKIINEYA